jgi:hypothetical protein
MSLNVEPAATVCGVLAEPQHFKAPAGEMAHARSPPAASSDDVVVVTTAPSEPASPLEPLEPLDPLLLSPLDPLEPLLPSPPLVPLDPLLPSSVAPPVAPSLLPPHATAEARPIPPTKKTRRSLRMDTPPRLILTRHPCKVHLVTGVTAAFLWARMPRRAGAWIHVGAPPPRQRQRAPSPPPRGARGDARLFTASRRR